MQLTIVPQEVMTSFWEPLCLARQFDVLYMIQPEHQHDGVLDFFDYSIHWMNHKDLNKWFVNIFS